MSSIAEKVGDLVGEYAVDQNRSLMNRLWSSIDLTAKRGEKDGTYEASADISVWKYRRFPAMINWPLATRCTALKPGIVKVHSVSVQKTNLEKCYILRH